jgi:hypothetical protein
MSRKRIANPFPELRSREDSHAMGLVRYYTGIPCKHRHLAERLVYNGACTECLYKTRRVLAPTQTIVTLDIVIDEPMAGDVLAELKDLLYAWTDHVLKAKGVRK